MALPRVVAVRERAGGGGGGGGECQASVTHLAGAAVGTFSRKCLDGVATTPAPGKSRLRRAWTLLLKEI